MSFNIGEILAHTLSPEQQIREEATNHLEAASRDNFSAYVVTLCQELSNEQSQPHIRTAAGLALKNTLTAKEEHRKEEMVQRWLAIDANTKAQVKQAVLATLASPDLKAGTVAAQAVSAIAAIEIPRGEWLDLIQVLLGNVTSTDNANLKQSTLQSLGFICESIDPEILATQANQILTAVVTGARKEEPSQEVRYAAITALYNSLEFIRENFEREGERNYIMQVVCEATQSPEIHVQVAAFECLVRIMQLYYDKMSHYMEVALFKLTVLGMTHEEEKVSLQAVEFWSTVCEEEIELDAEAAEALEYGEQPDQVNHHFAQAALEQIVPVLLSLLSKQEEDADEDEWNVAMAAATCLSLFAQCVENNIVSLVIPFVETHIRNTEWRLREAAVMAFGSILDGPDPILLEPLVSQAFPVFIDMMQDPVIHVKDTAAWTLGRICHTLIECIKPDVHLNSLVTALVNGLNDSPRIVSNCCWSLMNLSEQLGGDLDAETYPLSPYFEGIITALMRITDTSNNEANARTSAYEAISTFVTTSSRDCMPIISQLAVAILERLDAAIAQQNQIIGIDEKNTHFELQSNLFNVLTNISRRVGKDIHGLSDRIMTSILLILNSPNKHSTVLEDVFLCVGSLITALEGEFGRYLESFSPFLYSALQNHEEHQLCSIAVGLIGDICRGLGDQILPYCDSFMTLLVQNLQSPVLHRNVKPAILSCFGDIALAVGGQYEAYLSISMSMLQQACGMTTIPMNSYDMIEYVNQLREGIIEAYVGITQGLKTGDKAGLLLPHAQHIFSFMGMVYNDPERSEAVTRGMIGLLGDMSEAFMNGQIKQLLAADWINACLKEGRSSRHSSSSTRDVARWAREMVKRASV
ncbi:karyopherin Kap95 [Basidiobolus ranarum]|uniref:Karyopherin Kap95 n=1 Tax=Basidiobolus ranarum TaxID=34480 RepID=A0ABR2WRK6_9FUNG